MQHKRGALSVTVLGEQLVALGGWDGKGCAATPPTLDRYPHTTALAGHGLPVTRATTLTACLLGHLQHDEIPHTCGNSCIPGTLCTRMPLPCVATWFVGLSPSTSIVSGRSLKVTYVRVSYGRNSGVGHLMNMSNNHLAVCAMETINAVLVNRAVDTVEMYDPRADAWRALKSLTPARAYCAAATISGASCMTAVRIAQCLHRPLDGALEVFFAPVSALVVFAMVVFAHPSTNWLSTPQ